MRIAIIGGGLGGTTAGIFLQRAGFRADVYEQAPDLLRIGAGIQLQANVMRVMRAIGIDERLYAAGLQLRRWLSREWDSGRVIFEPSYPPEWVVIHRGDLLEILTSALEPGSYHRGKRLQDIEDRGSDLRLTFADGTVADADIVIGADGINSRLREILLGPEEPTYSGYIAYRSVFPVALLGDYIVPSDRTTKWWSDERHWDPDHIRYFMTYYLTPREIYFVTGAPDADWNGGSLPVPATKDEIKACYAGFHDEVQRVIDASPQAMKWPVSLRAPLPLWSRGRIVLLGDACHPMTPYMGQGAGMAIEDAAILTRCLAAIKDDPTRAFEVYRLNRIDRASRVQQVSHDHTWLAYPQDIQWVLGFDATTAPLTGLPGGA